MPNRAQRRAVTSREQQRPAPASSPDSKATIAVSKVSGPGRGVCIALGLEVDADGNVLLPVDQVANGELRQCFAGIGDAMKRIEVRSSAFSRDLTSANARELVAALLAYIAVFNVSKAVIDRLKGSGGAPVGLDAH